MSEKTLIRRDLVHEVGGGKAGFELHGPNWLAVHCGLNITDSNPDTLTPYKAGVPEIMREAYTSGNLTFRRLGELAITPGIIDITTSAGHHVEAIHQTLEELADRGVLGSKLTWLIEKPMTSSPEEAHALVELFDQGYLDIYKTFVNEHYLASRGLKAAEMIIAMEKSRAESDNEEAEVVNVDVVFNKNRVPDVLAGRFTDPQLLSYGIEMPHELVIGYRLAGVNPEEAKPEILENHYYDAVCGVPGSQGNYTVLQVANSARIRMAQGLGPYTMQANGDIIPREDQPTERYAEATLSNGATVRVEFGPIAGLNPLSTRITWCDYEGKLHQETMQDNILRTVMGGIATFSVTGVRPFFADDFNIPNGLLYARTLSQLAADGIR